MKIIKKLQTEFLKEAQNSPMLMSDLAHMETYIAESYHNRSVIELLQNADDANSSRFYIGKNQDSIVVANDGRFFNEDDVLSICRSGTSTKKRDGKTIGYRGIGFKSVVNLAERVHIISNSLRLTFSRELTNTVLNSDIPVPLIRIPHRYSPLAEHSAIINNLINNDFKTIFIFENLKPNQLEEEINAFDSSSLLFLRNIKKVKFDTRTSKVINVKRSYNNFGDYLTIGEGDYKEEWLVIRDLNEKENITSVAFLLDNNKRIVPLSSERSVVHSFMPTKDEIGLPFKINGDFSTDPSRTKVVYDTLSKESIDKCSNLIVDAVKRYVIENKNEDEDDIFYGLFEVLNTPKNSLTARFSSVIKFKDHFTDKLKEQIKREKWYNNVENEKLRINPEWLNSEDFNALCTFLKYVPLDKEVESRYPGILKFGKEFGLNTLQLEEILDATSIIELSINGNIEIISEFINKYRFSHEKSINKKISNAKIIHFSEGTFSLNNHPNSNFDEKFLKLIDNNLNDFKDFIWFINKFEPSLVHLLKNERTEVFINKDIEMVKGFEFSKNGNRHITNFRDNDGENFNKESFNNKELNIKSSISKWRAAETNLAAFLEMNDDIKKVIDVSKSNLGYDLEVHSLDQIYYIEVKSVDKIGSTISLTNNEYSTANELKGSYILAIVKQTDYGLEVCYINNPIEALQLTKRVTRWEWICDSYSGDLSNYYFG